jgi:hypothetical protein
VSGLWLAGLHAQDGSFNVIKGRPGFPWYFHLQRALIFKHSVYRLHLFEENLNPSANCVTLNKALTLLSSFHPVSQVFGPSPLHVYRNPSTIPGGFCPHYLHFTDEEAEAQRG